MVLEFCTSPHSPLSLYQYNSVITFDRVTVLALCTSSDEHLSMYQVSFNSFLYFQIYALDKLFIAKIKKESNSVNTGYGFCILQFLSQPKFHLFIFNTFRDLLRTSLLLQIVRKGNNSVITCENVTVLALCTSPNGYLSMYQVSFNSLLHFQRYAPDKLLIAKIEGK